MAAAIVNRQSSVRVSSRLLTRAAERALDAVGRAGGDVEILIVDDREMRRLHHAFLGVLRPTDVLAFPLEIANSPSRLIGQVVISAETARRQARRLGIPTTQELELLITHGVLHLIGYDDRDSVEAELMHRREREILESSGRPTPERLWAGLLVRSRRASVSGHPRWKPIARPPLQQRVAARPPRQRSRLAPGSGHPRLKPATRTPRQRSRLASVSGHPR